MEENEKTYQEIVIKLLAHQRHMMPELEELKRQGKLPFELMRAMTGAEEWKDVVDGDGGLEEAVSIEPVEKFAKALKDSEHFLDEHERRLAEEYCSLVGDLEKVFDDPLGSAAQE